MGTLKDLKGKPVLISVRLGKAPKIVGGTLLSTERDGVWLRCEPFDRNVAGLFAEEPEVLALYERSRPEFFLPYASVEWILRTRQTLAKSRRDTT